MAREVDFKKLQSGQGLLVIGRDGKKALKYRVVEVDPTKRFVHARLEWVDSHPDDLELTEMFMDRTRNSTRFDGPIIMLMEVDRKYLRLVPGRRRKSRVEKIASRICVAKLLKDYGISDSIYALVKSRFDKMLELISEPLEDEGKLSRELGLLEKGFKGTLLEHGKRVPRKLEGLLKNFKYEFAIKRGGSMKFVDDAAYYAQDKTLKFKYNPQIIMMIIGFGGSDRKRNLALLKRDIAKVLMTIRHEVTHAIRDANTGHIERYVSKMQADPRVREFYDERGHKELEFEVDAQINAIALLFKKKRGKKRNEISFDDIHRDYVGFRFPEKGTPAYKALIRRLARERMLTPAMVRDVKAIPKSEWDSTLSKFYSKVASNSFAGGTHLTFPSGSSHKQPHVFIGERALEKILGKKSLGKVKVPSKAGIHKMRLEDLKGFTTHLLGGIEEYTKQYREGVEMPPILIELYKDGKLQLLDGHHRLAAARKAGVKTIMTKWIIRG